MKVAPILTAVLILFSITACKKQVAVKAPDRTPVPAATATRPTPAPQIRAAQPEAKPAAEAPRRDYPTAAELDSINSLLAKIQDAYFDYDKHNLRPDAEEALRGNAQALAAIIKRYPTFKLVVEGHCDERGSDEYNLALGDARALKAKEYLTSLGLPAEQMNTVSYGKQKPVCTSADEDCWQKNRRAHLAVAALGPGR
jgi:peptidoglycan-associated lipoprotein